MPPRFRELKSYCENNGWVLIRQTDHFYYEKVLTDGRVLRTRVSFALHKEIPKHLWRRILERQLQVSEEEFYRGL
ncbi:MAG: type II toxin-antitoxin system HicA family toxin [Clostridia bacterium]|nr:MAG: type II toxin-antitoxin system HicA family toxin [Clostridia bacterium]